jgi:hypothetical protein
MRAPANVRLNRFTTRAITPVVLLGGLLLLAVYHFNGVLKTTQAQDNQFHGLAALSSGPLQVTFQRDAGTDRPLVQWNGYELLTYADWSSTLSVDAEVSELWNNMHGYTEDQQTHRVFATTTGDGWQVVEVVMVIDSRHLSVEYDFVARSGGQPTQAPRTVALTIQHYGIAWYEPRVAGNSFSAEVPPLTSNAAPPTLPLAPLGVLTLAVSGPALAPGGLQLGIMRTVVGSAGQQTWASQLTTAYQLTAPQVDRLIPLGVETLTFTPSAMRTGAPVGAPVTTPNAQP